VAHRRAHASDLAVLALREGHGEPGVRLAAHPEELDAGGARERPAVEGETFAQGLERLRRRHAADPRVIGLRDPMVGVGEGMAEPMVVRQD
jgi:hypothetical protein